MTAEFRVNSYQRNWQYNPDIVTFADGSFMIVWDSYFNNYDDTDLAMTYLAAQRYDAQGRPVGSELVLDAVNGSSSEQPDIVALSDGGFAVAYQFDNYDSILSLRLEVWVNIFNADGSLRRVLRVDQPDAQVNNAVLPEIVATQNGGFRVFWEEERSTAGFDRIMTRAFDGEGVALGRSQVANPNMDEFDQENPDSVQLDNGWAITVWRSEASFELGTPLDANELRGTLTDATGRIIRADFSLGQLEGTITEFGNNSGLAYDMAALAGGGFVLAHIMNANDVGGPADNFDDTVVLRFFDNQGNLTRTDRRVSETDELVFDTSVAQLDTGEIVVVWEQYPDVGPGEDVMGRIMSATGAPVSGVFRIGVNADEYDEQGSPVVRALAGGGFVVTYTSESIDTSHEGIAARIYGRGSAAADVRTVDVTGHMAGLGGDDRLTGNARANILQGNTGNDSLAGEGGDDRLIGGQGTDQLRGGSGNDRLAGQQGSDTLTGGAGADQFVLDRGGADRITDFGGRDLMLLDNGIFAGLGAAGQLAPGKFKILGRGIDADDRIIHDQGTGQVWYDGNGSGAGQRVLLAVVEGQRVLAADDFLVF